MMLTVSHVSWFLALLFIVCKWSNCDWVTQNYADGGPYVLVLIDPIIGGKCSDCDWVIHNCADGCISVLAPFSPVYSW